MAGLFTDDRVAVMLWGAMPGADESDPAVWRAASAHYDAQRERVLSQALGRPGFAAQWLNRWPSLGGRAGSGWLDVDAFTAARAELVPPQRPAVAAVEDWYGGKGGAVAVAWMDGDGLAVSAWRTESLAEAWHVAESAGRVLCGVSLVREPEARVLSARPRGTRENSDALLELRRLVTDGGLRWDGSEFGDQAVAANVAELTTNQLQLKGGGDSGLLRCAAWAVQECRNNAEPLLV